MTTSPDQPRARRLAAFPFHPILVAAFPVLALWSANITDAPAGDVVPVLGLVGLVAAVLTLTIGAVLGNLRRAALVVALLLLLFFTYGHIWPSTQHPAIGLSVSLVLFAVGSLVAVRLSVPMTRRLTVSLNLVMAALFILNGGSVIFGLATQRSALAATAAPTSEHEVDLEGRSLPDVWYLVPDRYARSDVLAESYGIDNSAFLDQLRARGFEVIDKAAYNYPSTLMSLASSLNLRYLDDLLSISETERVLTAQAMLRRHEVGRLFKEAGYEYLHLGSWADFSREADDADLVLTAPVVPAFWAIFAETTMLPSLVALSHGGSSDSGLLSHHAQNRLHAEHQLRTLDELARQPAIPGRPRFVFAHLILPHMPYVFDADGSHVSAKMARERSVPDNYGRQLEFTSRALVDLIDQLLARPEPPVILIQADEGQLPDEFFDTADMTYRDFSDKDRRFHAGILSAVRVPNGQPLVGEGRTTAVNVVRLLVDRLLGTELGRLPDQVNTPIDKVYGDYFDITDLAFR